MPSGTCHFNLDPQPRDGARRPRARQMAEEVHV